MSSLRISTIRPGYLVSLSTKITGNVSYAKRTIEEDHVVEDGARKSTWETTRTVFDPVEHEEAVKVRGRCRTLVTAICAPSDFGLLCPETSYDRLALAVQEARELANEFNARAGRSNIQVYVITGRVAQDDVEAVRAINSEVRDLISTMERGLVNLDVKTVRDAANRARSLGSMLSAEASERVKDVIATARSAARQIVKAGEEGSAEIDQATLRKIADGRMAFLDLDGAHEIATPDATGRAIDLVPEETQEADYDFEAEQLAKTRAIQANQALDLDDNDEIGVPVRTPVSIDID